MMSRIFVSANSEFISGPFAPVTATPFTVACWFYHSNDSTSQEFWYLGDFDTGTLFFAFSARSGGQLRFTARQGGSAHATTTATFPLNTWNHACGVARASDDRTVFLNGGDSVDNTSDTTPTNLDTFGLGARTGENPSQHFDGRIGEFGLWNIALDDFEVKLLGPQYRWSPLLVRRENLVWYESFRSPDYHYDLEHRRPKVMLTNFGSTFDPDHPFGIVYPRERMVIATDQAAAPAGDPEGSLIGGKLIRGGLLSGRLVG